MKAVAWIRIILWSLVTVLLTALMVFLITGNRSGKEMFLRHIRWDQARDKTWNVVAEHEIDALDVDSLRIEWENGTVSIGYHQGEKILVVERRSGRARESSSFQMQTLNGTLYLTQHEDAFPKFSLWLPWNQVIKEILLPEKKFREIILKGTSGILEARHLAAALFQAELTSGKATLTGLEVDSLEFNMTSGTADIDGIFKQVELNATSGLLRFETPRDPSSLALNITSGKAIVAIPGTEGFSLTLHQAIGTFRNAFQLDGEGRHLGGGYHYAVTITTGMVDLQKRRP